MKKTFVMGSLLLLAAPAMAQEAAPVAAPGATVTVAAPAPVTACELHVWPAERFQAMTTGWGAGLGIIGALADASGHADGDKARRANLAAALDPEGQVTALQKLDLVGLLGLQSSQVVTHAEALDVKTAKTAVRHSASTSLCYAELVVTGVLYQKAAIYGRSLKTSFLFRNFGSAQEQPTRLGSTGGNGLKLFPPKDGADVTASNEELVSVFQRNFIEAAANMVPRRAVASN